MRRSRAGLRCRSRHHDFICAEVTSSGSGVGLTEAPRGSLGHWITLHRDDFATPASRIVVLGVGNILLRDEGVGVHVLEELRRGYAFPPNVELIDGGTAGYDLLPIVDGADHLLVIDCVKGGLTPGTIWRFTPDVLPERVSYHSSVHQLGLLEVLAWAERTGHPPQTVIVGVQPGEIAPGLELTPEVQARLPRVIEQVLEELRALGIEPLPLQVYGHSP